MCLVSRLDIWTTFKMCALEQFLCCVFLFFWYVLKLNVFTSKAKKLFVSTYVYKTNRYRTVGRQNLFSLTFFYLTTIIVNY